MDWKVLYTIGKLLKCRCLKWSWMTHLDIWNRSYGQKAGHESNWQFDSRPLKVGNWPDFLACRWHATYCWKALDEGYNFSSNFISIRGIHTKLWDPKITRVPTLGIWMSQPYFEKVWGWDSHSWNGDLEVLWDSRNSEFDYKGQNTSYWSVFYIIGKLSKCKCRKWARMNHLDIFNTSYGKKKGRERNWQFDSWPLKVRNRPDLNAWKGSATHRWKALNESYNFALNIVPIGGLSKEL
jgi:hypothetical protein